MRFIKIFLVSFASLVGVIGLALGGMYLAGTFSLPSVMPQQIAFEKNEYEVAEDFQMIISTTTLDVTEKSVSLSFTTSETVGNEFVTDGIITVPKNIVLGEPFTVTLNKENRLMNGEYIQWIKGGISTIKATSKNAQARTVTAKVYVDVPVYSLSLSAKTALDFESQNSFNIGSNFWVEANYIPQDSMYKFSKSGSNGTIADYKTIFFSSLSNALSQTSLKTHTSQQFNALMQAEDAIITAQVFSSAVDENEAFLAVEDYENEELKYSTILGMLDLIEGDKKAENHVLVNFDELAVGTFSASSSTFAGQFNKSTKIFANKQTSLQNTYNLQVEIMADDNATQMQSEISKVAIAVAVETQDGYVNANSNQFLIEGDDYIWETFYGQDFKFYFPVIHQININESYWQLVTVAQNLSAKLFVVLFDFDGTDYVANAKSLENGNPKYSVEVESSTVVSNQIYWNNVDQAIKTLYVYDNIDETQTVYQQFDLKEIEYIIPNENTYKSVLYFAYMEELGGAFSNEFVGNYITIGSKMAQYKISTDEYLTLYEIPSGVITPKGTHNFPQGMVIKVVMATIKTTYNGMFLLDGDYYEVDKFSSTSAIGTMQTLSFEVAKTLKTVDSHLLFNSNFGVLSNDTLAVIHGCAGAFEVVFDIPQDQQEIFVRDWNDERIDLIFKINGQIETRLFTFTRQEFVYNVDSENEYRLLVNVDYIAYELQDSGYRNFTVEVSYQRGYEPNVYMQIASGEFYSVEQDSYQTVDDPIFEVYDGLISEISFASDLSQITYENPLYVRTSLEKDETLVHGEVGINYASTSSTNSIVFNGINFDKSLLYDAQSNKFRIIALDKYARPVLDESLWTLVSSDQSQKVLTVDATGQYLNFLGNSVTPIEVSISSNYGIGQSFVTSPYSIYFDVKTLGRLVYVSLNTSQIIGNDDVKYQNYDPSTYNLQEDSFELVDVQSIFSTQTLTLSMVGTANQTVYLTEQGQVNLLKMYYALPNEYGRYNIFDLLNITKFGREDSTSFADFIQFNYDGETQFIKSFTILKEFGQTGYLNLNAQTEIGINISLRIEITSNISPVADAYGHENVGAQGGYQNSIRHIGVFAKYEIDIPMSFSYIQSPLQFNFDDYTPLLYDAQTNAVVAIKGQNIGLNVIEISGNSIIIQITLDDISAVEYKHFVFVLDSRTSIDLQSTYSKYVYDYSRDYYFRVNPNIIGMLNGENENIEVDGVNAIVKVATQNVIDVIGITDVVTNSLFTVKRIVGNSNLSTEKSSNYVTAKITNSLGQSVSSQYFLISENNILQLKSPFVNSQSIYITLLHYVSATKYYVVGTFYITILPDIIEKEGYEQNFVIYDNVKYLQLESGVEYYFFDDEFEQNIVSNFDVLQDVDFNLNISFDSQYVNSTTFWQIAGNKIFIRTTTQILVGKIFVNVEIMGVAKTSYPIIIMPKKAPLVKYNLVPNSHTTEDLTHTDRNMQANLDLVNLLSIDYLVENDIYDTIEDGLTFSDNVSVLAKAEKDYGIYISQDEVVLYTVLNGNGGFEGTDVASIRTVDGVLATNFVGNDTYIIIVASVKGINIYYRLKIISSLNLNAYYPYLENSEVGDDEKAEYILYKQGDSAKTITINTNFSNEIPATTQKIDDVYELVFDEETQTNVYVLKETYINNRFMMFRNVLLQNSSGKILMNYAIESVVVKSIETGLMTDLSRTSVPSENFGGYVTVNYNETLGKVDITLKNVMSYVVVLKITTTSNATVEYRFAVERTTRVYDIVEKQLNEDISQMPLLSENYEVKIESPAFDEEKTQSLELQNKYLRMKNGPSFEDRTDILMYHIIDNTNNLLDVVFENSKPVLEAQYSVNSVFAKLMFYTKYGPVRTIDVMLESLIKVVDYDFDVEEYNNSPTTVTQKFIETVYAGQEYNLQEMIKFVEIDASGASEVGVLFTDIDFVYDKPIFVDIISLDKIVILPIGESTEENVNFIVETLINAQEFVFEFEFHILPAIYSNNSSSLNLTPVSNDYYSLGNIELDIFNEENAFFTNLGRDIELVSSDNVINGQLLEDYPYFYTLNVTILSGASAIKSSRQILNGKLLLQTNAVSYETEILICVDLIFVKNNEEGIYEFISTSYLSLILKPDTEVMFYYPKPADQMLDFESIYYNNTTVEFDVNSAFQTADHPRIKLTSLDEVEIESKNIYLTYQVVSGDPNLIVTGGEIILGETNKFDYFESQFQFEFSSSSSFTYATIDFEIFVSGISRGIYTVRVYKEISSVYGISITNINTLDGRNEIFYLGEDRRDIFNGVQALKFTISSALLSDVNVRILKQTTSGVVNTGVVIPLLAQEKGLDKIFKINTYSEMLKDLTLQNVRFSISGENYLTLSQMSNYFAQDQYNVSSFEIARRVVVTYLGFEILDDEFLNNVQVIEPSVISNSGTFESFKTSTENLGGSVRERNDNLVQIYVGTSATNENILGTYYYSIKVNLVVEKEDEQYNILVGETKTRMLGELGVKKQDGSMFVSYSGENAVIDSEIVNREIVLNMTFKTLEENPNRLDLIYADTLQQYSHSASVEPLQYSPNRKYNSELLAYYSYDFSIMALGAPNSSILGTILLSCTFNDKYSTSSYEFVYEIEIKVIPNWEITLKNGVGGLNSEQSPEIINADYFETSNEYIDYLVDVNNSQSDKVIAIRTNYVEDGNRANYDLRYSIVYPVNFENIAEIVSTSSVKAIKIYKPTFAERTIKVRIYDLYNYEVLYYYTVVPEETISYFGLSGQSVYEGDSMIIQHEGLDSTGIDHVVLLTTDLPSSTIVSLKLKTTDGGVDLDAIIEANGTLAQAFSIKYIDGNLFSPISRTLSVYLEISLRQTIGGEEYVVRTANFALYQRYGAVSSNMNVEDAVPTNLINHVQIFDFKESANIGEPELYNEKTLVALNENFVGSVTVLAYNQLTTKPIIISVLDEDFSVLGKRYYMISELASGTIEDLNNYSYLVSSINDQSQNMTVQIISNTLSVGGNGLLPDTKVTVHLTNGTEFRNYVLTKQTPISLGSSFWGILGYEIESGMAILVLQDELEQQIGLNVIENYEFEVTLTNKGTVVSNVNKLVLKQSSQSPYNSVLITDNIGNQTTVSILTDEENGYYISLGGNTGDGQDWYISAIAYNNNFNPNMFKIKNDKKLVINTLIKEIEGGEYDFVNVNLIGYMQFVKVYLNKNGKQVISLMEYWDKGTDESFNASNYQINESNPIDNLAKIKGMTYYNDTLEILFGTSDRTVNMGFRLTRARGGQETHIDFSVTLKAYPFSYNLGISKSFGDMILPNDEYFLEVISLQTVNLESLQINWPNYLTEENIIIYGNYVGAEIGSYIVTSYDEIEIENGMTTIYIDSQLAFESEATNKLISKQKYYIIKFKDAYYVLDAIDFKVSPYFYGLDTSKVYTNEGGVGQRIITDYSQRTSGGEVSYVVSFESWAKNIFFTNAYGQTLLNNIINETHNGIIAFDFEDGGSGQGYLDTETYELITEDITPGLTYFTINVLVALNGEVETLQWLNIGSILLGFDSNPQYFLQPKDEFGNKIGYTIAVKQNDDISLKYIEITGDEPVTFSTNSLFSDENIDSYEQTQTTVTNLSNVYLTEKETHKYQLTYTINQSTTLNYILQSTFINSQKPVVTAVNLKHGEVVSFTLNDGINSYSATYNHSGTTLYGTISTNLIVTNISDGAGGYYTFATLPNIQNYTISTNAKNVAVVWTKLDFTAIKTDLSINFFGDGISSNYIQGLVANVNASRLFKLKKLSDEDLYAPNISKVEVLIDEKGMEETKTQYFAITQINYMSSQYTNYAQTYLYKAENNTSFAKKVEIELNQWNTNYFVGSSLGSYSPLVIVQKLDSIDEFNFVNLIKVNGYYSHSFGTYSTDIESFDNKFEVVKYVSSNDIINLNFENENVVDVLELNQTLQPVIYTKLLSNSGENVDINLTLETNETATIVLNSSTNNEYTYLYFDTSITSLSIPQTTSCVILKSTQHNGELIWHELKNQSLPLGVIYYSIYNTNWQPQSPRYKIDGLSNGDLIGKLWDGTIELETAFNDDDHVKIAYGNVGDADFMQVYFEVGSFRLQNSNIVKVGQFFKSGENLIALDFDRLSDITLLESLSFSENGIYAVKYSQNSIDTTYALFSSYGQEIVYDIFDFIFISGENGNSYKELYESNITIQKLDYSSLGWSITEFGVYGFSQGDMFEIVDLTQSSTYNLFDIFNVDLLLSDNGEIEVSKITDNLIVFSGVVNGGYSFVNVRVQTTNGYVDYYDVEVVFEVGLYSVTLTDFISKLSILQPNDKTVQIYQIDQSGSEITQGAIVVNNNNFSIVEYDVYTQAYKTNIIDVGGY